MIFILLATTEPNKFGLWGFRRRSTFISGSNTTPFHQIDLIPFGVIRGLGRLAPGGHRVSPHYSKWVFLLALWAFAVWAAWIVIVS